MGVGESGTAQLGSSGHSTSVRSGALGLCIFIYEVGVIVSTGFPGGTVVKNPPANAGDTRDTGSIPGSGRSPGVGNGNPLQYFCLGNPMDREAWRARAHEAAKSRTQLSSHTYTIMSTRGRAVVRMK